MTGAYHIANDNEKISIARRVINTHGARRQERPAPHPATSQSFGQKTAGLRAVEPTSSDPRVQDLLKPKVGLNVLTLLAWLFSIGSVIVMHRDLSAPLQSLSTDIVFGWASLALYYVSKHTDRTFFKNLSLLSVLASLAFMTYDLHAGFNMHLSAGVTLCCASAILMIIGASLREALPLLASAILSALWIGMTTFGAIPAHLIWLYPSLFIMQYVFSSKLRSPWVLTLSCMTTLLWMGGLFLGSGPASLFPADQILGVSLILALTYHRFGKRLQDTQSPLGLVHTNMAWSLCFALAIGLQYVWGLAPEALRNESHLAQDTVTLIGVGVTTMAGLALLAISARRAKGGHQSRTETCTLLAAIMGLTLFLFRPEMMTGLWAYFNTAPHTLAFFVLGGVLAASALAMIINGARRGYASMILLGLAALVAELYLVLPPLAANAEHLYMFGYTFMFSVLFLALFAQQKSKTDPYPATHYAPTY